MPDSFALPEDLDGLDLDALKALEPQAVKAFTDRHEAGAATQADLEALEPLAEAVRTVRAAVAAKAAEAITPDPAADPAADPQADPAPAAPTADATATLDRYLEALAAKDPDPAPAADPATAPAAVDPAPAPAPAAPASAPAPAPAPVSIAAAVDPPIEDVQLPVAAGPVTIVASADIPGVRSASELSGLDGLVAAMGAKSRVIAVTASATVEGMPHHPVASIQLPWKEERNVDGLSESQLFQKLNDLASPAYLMAALTASGEGWCAPSETIYTFACEVEAPPEELDLPTTTTSRGGQRFPISPTYSDFRRTGSDADRGLFSWTEDDDRAAATGSPTKPCFKIPCVEFDEARLVIQGLCVTSGNMMDKAYPELQRRYMSLVLNAHLHRMNRLRILAAVAEADDHVTAPATFAAASQFLAQLELQVQDLRDQFSMSEDALVEAMAPRWLRGPIRADVARRDYGGDLNAVSNADIANYLQASGIRLQFVTDWQELGDPNSPATAWPTSVDFLLWIPGSIRRLTGPSLDIAVARDSVQNSTNDFTLAMTEESWKVYKPGCGVRLVTIPFCPSGQVGDREALSCS